MDEHNKNNNKNKKRRNHHDRGCINSWVVVKDLTTIFLIQSFSFFFSKMKRKKIYKNKIVAILRDANHLKPVLKHFYSGIFLLNCRCVIE